MQELLPELAIKCRKWVENPEDIQIIINEDADKANFLIGFMEPDLQEEWALAEFRYANMVLTEEHLLRFFSQLPAEKNIKAKVIFTQKGFTEKAGILAAQNRTWISFFDYPTTERPYHGYRIAVLNRQELMHEKGYQLSPSDWDKVHEILYKSEQDYWGKSPKENLACIYNSAGEKICTWPDLIFGLPLDNLDTHQNYTFSFSKHRLKVGAFDIPINGVKFNYFTQSRKIDKKDAVDALEEVLANYVFY